MDNLKENFIVKGNKIHDSKYNYSLVEYVNNKTKVKIICQEHGIFEQTPDKHINGKQGCPKCGGTVKKTRNEIIEVFNTVHKSKYDYSLIEYINSKTKVKIICQEHGVFEQAPKDHKNGQGCPKCWNKYSDFNNLLEKVKTIHNNKYDYSLTEYINNKCNVKIICPEHGIFKQSFESHLKGIGCPYCSDSRHTTKTFINKANKVHNNKYDYSLVEYISSSEKIKIICPEHGIFEQTPANHLSGSGCKKCGITSFINKKTMTKGEFIERSRLVHGDKYDYSETIYSNCKEKCEIRCDKHGYFSQIPDSHIRGNGCPKCGITDNKSEKEVKEYIKSLNIPFIENDRIILNGKELDIFIPSYNIAIEYDGLYWHSDLFVENNYHLNKTSDCESNGIRLIHIFEDEWMFKKDIVKSRIKNILGLTENSVYARRCIIKEIGSAEAKLFLNNNHIQGYTNTNIRLGLYYNNELMSVMLFNKPRKGIGNLKEGYELSRFANKMNHTIIGGASKLLKYFIKKYNPTQIISYADRRWSQGELYENLGFRLSHINKPNYWYVFDYMRKHRFLFRKKLLIKEGYDGNLTEKEVMKQRGIRRIYDCGTKTYLLNLN